MIDLGFAAMLALVAAGAGKRLLDRLKQSPAGPLDSFALALPLGLGLISLATLGLGEIGCLNRIGLAIVLAVSCELSVVGWIRLWREWRASRSIQQPQAPREFSGLALAAAGGMVICATLVSALAPVTDGDALCYHLQVPKVFLTRSSVAFLPDLHETVYPLLTELLYAAALEFRGPVACRGIQWVLGLVFAANVLALARPSLGRRAWWAGAIAMLVPAISNGMSAPLNDVALAAFGTAAIFAWVRLHERPGNSAALVAGVFAGLALGVKYPALVLFGLLTAGILLRYFAGRREAGLGEQNRRLRLGGTHVGPLTAHHSPLTQAQPWLRFAGIYVAAAAAVGIWWYLRAYVHTGNPVFPFFRTVFGSGLDEVLDPIKRPLAVTPWNLLSALGPLSVAPDRFDSYAHQFGPVFLLFLPALLFERAPRRVLVLAALGYAFLTICMTQRQSMRFLLVAIGPMSIAVAYVAARWCDRKTAATRLLTALLVVVCACEATIAVARLRHALPVLLGRESAADFLARREPTFQVGRWAAEHLPLTAHLFGQDHRGFYIPRAYTMELAHRRRTGLGRHGESSAQIVARLRELGFTHLLLCPPKPESAAEFDPTLGRLLGPWLADRTPLYCRDLADSDGLVRAYSIYDLADGEATASRPANDRLSARFGAETAR
jgi:Dolichyl-phosphate-mannose-protein mannosyltransferase